MKKSAWLLFEATVDVLVAVTLLLPVPVMSLATAAGLADTNPEKRSSSKETLSYNSGRGDIFFIVIHTLQKIFSWFIWGFI